MRKAPNRPQSTGIFDKSRSYRHLEFPFDFVERYRRVTLNYNTIVYALRAWIVKGEHSIEFVTYAYPFHGQKPFRNRIDPPAFAGRENVPKTGF
jgi:hypothetical protein